MNLVKPKRGNPFIDIAKEQNVWLYRIIDPKTYLVSTDPEFKNSDDMYHVNTGDMRALYKQRSQTIANKVKVPTTAQNEAKNSINQFFDKMALKIPFNCENCGKPLYANNKFAKRCITAHILPKSEFPSISTNENNIIYLGCDLLGICDCHDRWDKQGSANRVTMKVYDKALANFEFLKPHLTDHELVKAYTYLNLKWEQ